LEVGFNKVEIMEKKEIRKIKKGIKISVFLFSLIAFLVFFLTIEEKTFIALRRIKPIFLILSILSILLFLLLEGIKITLLSSLMGGKVSPLKGVELITTGHFLAAVTPFQVSGLPYQLYLLNKTGFSPGKGGALLTARGIFIYLPILIVAPFAFKLLEAKMDIFLKGIFTYLALIFFLFFFLLIVSMTNPKKVSRILFSRWPRLKELFERETEKMKKASRMLLRAKQPSRLLLILIVSLFSLLFLFGSVPLILLGLGLTPNPLKAMSAQLVLQASLIYTPTPGAVGVAEAIGAKVYSIFCPKYLLGIFIILWRFHTMYMSAIIGGILLLKETARL